MDFSKSLHPAIFTKLDELEREMTRAGHKSPEVMDVIVKHQQMWVGLYGKPFFRAAGTWFLASLAMLFSAPHIPPEPLGVGVGVAGIAAMGMSAAQAVRFLRRNRRTAHPEEFRNLARAIKFDEVEAAYVQAIADLAENQTIPLEQQESLAQSLNTLLTDHYRLREALTAALRPDHRTLTEEREQLMSRLDRTEDPATRAALERSLALLDERDRRFTQTQTQIERVEAQAELVRQCMLSTREMIVASQHASEPFPLAPIHQAVAEAHTATRAVEDAMEEVLRLNE